MPTMLIVMIVGSVAFAFWSAGRGAAERAEVLGRKACTAAGVQLLDQTVHVMAIRLYRGDDGWLGARPHSRNGDADPRDRPHPP